MHDNNKNMPLMSTYSTSLDVEKYNNSTQWISSIKYQTNNMKRKIKHSEDDYVVPLKAIYSANYKSPETHLKLIEHRNVELFEKNDDNKKLGPPKYYIINFKNFNKIGTNEPLPRISSIADVKALQKMFQQFEMKGETFEDLTLEELKRKILEISSDDFSENSAIVLVIMSHGDTASKIYAKDGIFELYSDIIDPISKNKYLSDKPKIFFIEACKGTKDLRNRSIMSLDTNSARSDTFIFEAAFEKYVSYRDRVDGSLFTQSLCQNITEMGKTKNIHEICIAVIKDVKHKTKNYQCPTITHNLTTDFCFGNYS